MKEVEPRVKRTIRDLFIIDVQRCWKADSTSRLMVSPFSDSFSFIFKAKLAEK